jgi:hypothetical protein
LIANDDGINGGYIYVNAIGDGIDINDPVEMNDGVVIVNSLTENMNGALGFTRYFNITGGFLVTVGSAGMAQALSQSSILGAARLHECLAVWHHRPN